MRVTGTVVHRNNDRGFTFVRPHRAERDVFAHISAYERTHNVKQGDEVTFEIIDTPKGRAAIHVLRVER